ncbi:helix-turn-helix domain-containing protein [Hydrogenophaga laconesensis]|uniref:Transcriptional regulator with XRE-family HTH domain n=1 Tax=Hydrogenophaga laconesensis TaxID=1805971 RepID=A0ABU1V988_9BURK|nr:helix-turn-helix transcriptional regulator [Hydrogenophaga laconesensis]MDR7094023.1 transcriptional regulator with XRE-family HTH domain [Hydrogenophaga laconesensis]
MPTYTKVLDEDARLLKELGMRLRLARKRRSLSAEKLAELAGITRVTLNRLEVGEPAAATLGTLTKVMGALGMAGDLMLLARDDRAGHQLRDASLLEPRKPALPRLIALKDLPCLRTVAAWHLPDADTRLTPEEVFNLYERNWRYIEPEKIVGKEAAVLKKLTKTVGKGVLLV